MTLTTILYYLFASFACCSVIAIFLLKNILYSALMLLIALLGIAAIYVLLGADFLAITQIVIYVGGVLILIMFGIMLTYNKTKPSTFPLNTEKKRSILALIVGFVFFGILVYFISIADFSEITHLKNFALDKSSKVKPIGIAFMTHYLIAFELIALILLIALIGATKTLSKK